MKRKNLFKLSIFLLGLIFQAVAFAQDWNPNHKIGSVSGVYHFAYNQVPHPLYELSAPATPNSGFVYQWEQSTSPTSGFTSIIGGTQTYYTFPGPLGQTTYFRRKTMNPNNWSFTYSNVLKISVVTTQWEDMNYVREHDVKVTGVMSWQSVDQLPIGQKLQTTTYLDGLGRPIQQVSRETATPANQGSLWGDIVQFSQYDEYGKELYKYLPYTTTTQSGKYKTSPLSEQPQYYLGNYGESHAYMSLVFDNSPLHKVTNMKEPGTAWATSSGMTTVYDVNDAADNVRAFSVDYVQGNPPVVGGVCPANSLYKHQYLDENLKLVIEYTNKYGQLVLKKVQLDDNPADAYNGWMCTYYVYDDFGQLRYELLPEAVKYLYNNGWSFAGNGTQVLNGYCYQYNYDDKGRLVWRKAPGALAATMIYDARDRIVFAQDGNQSTLPTPQWTATIYDELDRPLLTTLYNTNKSVATLRAEAANAPTSSSFTIYNTDNTGGTPITVNASLCPLTYSDLNTSPVTTVLRYTFYDNYSYPNVKGFNTGYNNLTAYSNSDPNVQPIATTNRTLGMITGYSTRVLGSNTFLKGTNYYNDDGLMIQGLEDHIKSGTDITTLQYHFDGRLLSSCTDHTTAGTGYTNYQILSKYNFDKLGRITSMEKQFGGSAMKTIASYDYDDMGKLKTKHLAPGYTGTGGNELESLVYTFDIHGKLTGINKDYALKTPGNYNKWDHFFGMYLGSKFDNIFTNPRLNGQISGVLWNTQGDDAQRKYDYVYDNAGRLVNANFSEQQQPGSGWSNSTMDFSVSGYTGQITYDLNGNITSMSHMGVMPGTSSPLVIDDLRYSYQSFSNKLSSVSDLMPNSSLNGLFGDLKDGANGGNPDYVYDNNGNVVIDLNKDAKDLNNVVGASGIHYNYLDKPDQIRIAGKGTISIVYSADGKKLQRVFTPESGPATYTTYVNQFVYQSVGGNPDALSMIHFEEGRLRVITPTYQNNGYDLLQVDGNVDLPNGKKGVFDYYVMDYQGNVRMVLTEEVHTAANTATMETWRSSVEVPVFGQVGVNNEVETTRYAAGSTSWQNNDIGSYVSRLGNNAGKNIGPNTLQKVMAGDVVNANVMYYFPQAASGNNPGFVNNVLNSIFSSLTNGPTTNLVKNGAGNVSNSLGADPNFVNAVQPTTSSGSTPLAYLTVLFFDERFNFISAQDGGAFQQQVASSVGAGGSSLTISGVKAPRNGYVYVYVSNQSHEDVYFDNMAVSISQGRIVEENHYYSFGLRIAAISSRKFQDSYNGDTKNNYGMQGAFAEMDDDIGWNEFPLRNYDPQIGRFVQADPFGQFGSPYQAMGNDPANIIDPSGGVGIPCPGTSAIAIFLENAVYAVGNALNAITPVANIIGNVSTLTQTGFTFVKAVEASNITNGQIATISISGAAESGGAVSAPQSGGEDDDWHDLTKEALEKLVDQYSPRTFTSRGKKENYMGNVFEQNFHYYASLLWKESHNYLPNPKMDELDDGEGDMQKGHSNRKGAIIDAKRDVIKEVIRGPFLRSYGRYRHAAWYEIKATKNTIWLSTRKYQILSELQLLKQTHPDACALGIAQYVVVTTASKSIDDLKVGWSVYAWGARNGIEVINVQPQYRIKNGQVEVRFGTYRRVETRRGSVRDYIHYPLITTFIF
jgi:RHS repeat-associated protein